MNIAALQYTLKYNSLEIYVSGCDGYCKGCHNPELRDYTLGKSFRSYYREISHKVQEFKTMIDWIWILGGEPLLQDPKDLVDLLMFLNCLKVPIVLFTRFELDQISEAILEKCDYIKTGWYDESKKVDGYRMFGIDLATSNQKIYKVKDIKNG